MKQSDLAMAFKNSRSAIKRKATDNAPTASSTATGKQQPRPQKRTKVESKMKPECSSTLQKPDELLQITEETGDIFDAPPNTLIIHACNCQGSWGAGIAKAFKDRYPKAYMQYVYHCRENDEDKLFGTAQMIPPVDASADEDEDEGFAEHSPDQQASNIPKHFVGCLYTSRHHGRKKDKPAQILAKTKPAMEDLLKQVQAWNAKADAGNKVEEVRMCKINSGLFAVPWEKTKQLLESIDVGNFDVKVIKVVSPPG
ncbi:ADP-ribose 1''-phosphate phosphatase [Vermiconidia calcicola]|uniref:ADP-ribose 1''-phosphate phosphatase n=1 Tax=Vermiconidia calcicola TaxID=1690605 RepID=A0ACC3NQF3_9PEZI|nr:ADP-ribose 1''-phosphate phosphatase [Vermiconidia calcicola]